MEHLLDLRLVSSGVEKATPGNFGVEISAEEVRVPDDVLAVAASMNLRNVPELWSALSHFIGAIAELLEWDVDIYEQAVEKWRADLRGVLDDEWLDHEPEQHAFGALDPRDLPAPEKETD